MPGESEKDLIAAINKSAGGPARDIHIDRDKAARMLALMLREEAKLLPAQANALADKMCSRLISAMPTPTKPGMRGTRMIRRYPDHEVADGFRNEISSKLADIDDRLADQIWEMVYERCRDLPSDIVEPAF